MAKEKSARARSGQEEICERLEAALEGLRKDVTRVEVWAAALGAFAKPVPEYKPDKRFELGRPESQREK